jgi:hypothetical protein
LLAYTNHAIAFPPPVMELRPSKEWNQHHILVIETAEKGEDGVFSIAFTPAMPLTSSGTLRTEIYARPLGPNSTELSVHACLYHGDHPHLFCRSNRQRAREEQTLSDVQESMRVLFVHP